MKSGRVFRALTLGLAVALVTAPPILAEAPPAAPDAEVERGVQQVQAAEYDTAILTLDTAARRLVAEPARSRELARAYLYLGIAYLAKGHEASARARFREALAQSHDLRLPPEDFAPRVIELFERAKEDVAAATPSVEPKGGGHKALWIGGAVVAAGAGAALAVGGGGGGGNAGSGPPRTTAFDGLLGPNRSPSAEYFVTPERNGACEARLTWTDARTVVRMFVNDAATQQNVTDTVDQTTTASMASWTCTAGKRYQIELFLQPPMIEVSYHLEVSVPG